MAAAISVTQRGIEALPAELHGSFDVYFDDRHVWSFSREPAAGSTARLVAWPRPMRQWLTGSARVVVRQGSAEPLVDDEVVFSPGDGRVDMVDGDGIPVMVDKWGLIQRPFSGRGEGVVAQMVDITDQVITVLADECDVHCWVAFGSLLGAAREGGVIAHDSDIDLAYLSDQRTPAGVNREMYAITRALRAHGFRVLNKSGSFVTVLFKAPDGGTGSLDVYSCFYVSGLLHETATIRADVPRSAIEPLGSIEFEGRSLPAPADPETMLEVSYGEGWRIPDPSFQHRPGRDVTRRFDGWTGSLMKNRREWERFHKDLPAALLQRPTELGAWALTQMDQGVHTVDIGAGTGRDVLALARSGRSATGLDYARAAFGRALRIVKDEDLPATFAATNLCDRRDAMSQAALLANLHPGTRAVLASGLLDSLEPSDRDNFFPMLRILLHDGGRAYLEFAHDLSGWTWKPEFGGRRWAVAPEEVGRSVAATGGRIEEAETVQSVDGMICTRMVAHW